MEDVWETIESLLDDITTGTISWTGSFPTKKITSKSDYPMGIIDNAEILSIADLNLDFTTAQVDISIPVTIYDTNPKQVNEIMSDVLKKISDSKSTLEGVGIFFGNPLTSNMDSGIVIMDKIKVHWMMVNMDFVYIYNR